MKLRKLLIQFLLLCMSVLLITGCGIKKQEVEFSQLGAICELATLRCYYHNVAEFVDGKDSIFHFGYRKMWIEYAGIVTVGIDVSKVTASKPDQDGIIKVTIPKAEVLAVDFDEDSISELIETGILASVTAKEKTDTFAFAQADMEKTARENDTLLIQGQERAKKVIEGYIKRVGTALGKSYAVEWVGVD